MLFTYYLQEEIIVMPYNETEEYKVELDQEDSNK